MELHTRFLHLNFFPLAFNRMIFISRLWEGEDFFQHLNYDLILWDAFLLSCWSLSIFCHTLWKLIISIIASLLMQSLKLSFQPRVPNSSTPSFPNFQQLFITPIIDDACHLLPPLIDNVTITYIFPHLPMTLSMLWCLCQVNKGWCKIVGEIIAWMLWNLSKSIIRFTENL